MVRLGPNDGLDFLGVVFILVFACFGIEQARSVLPDSSWFFYESLLILDEYFLLVDDLSLRVFVLVKLGVVGKLDDSIFQSLLFGCLLGSHYGEDLLLPRVYLVVVFRLLF